MALIRTVPAAMQAALDSGAFYPVIMVYLDWPDGEVFAHTGAGTIAFDGADWLGVGQFGAVQLPEESASLAASSATLKLLGVPDEILSRMDDPIRNRAGRVLFGCATTRGGNVLVADPVEVFAGYMDALRYTARASGGQIVHGLELRVASGPSARASASIYHSHEDQSARHPGDTLLVGLIHNEAESAAITWPES